MKKTIVTTLLSIFCCLLSAQDFTEANEQYAAGQYADAATIYEQCLNSNSDRELTSQSTAVIYYNLGNAYFKQGELAQAILAYERSLRLNPRDKDARHNLHFAQSRIVDNIEDTHAFFLSSWLRALRDQLSEGVWFYLSICLLILMCIGALVFALATPITLRKTAFHIAWVALLFCIWTGINAYSVHQRDTQRREAIITQGIVNAKSSPDKSGTDLFTLHEGTKVSIHETIGDWCNIHVGNHIGWIQISNLERI